MNGLYSMLLIYLKGLFVNSKRVDALGGTYLLPLAIHQAQTYNHILGSGTALGIQDTQE